MDGDGQAVCAFVETHLLGAGGTMDDETARKELQEAGREYESNLADALARQRDPRGIPETSYGMPLKSLYTPEDVADCDYLRDVGFPGGYPFTRGIRPDMYRGRLWTMRQYAGYDTVEETNLRFRHLLQQGLTGMNVAFDLPTQLGMDPDHPPSFRRGGESRHFLSLGASDGGPLPGVAPATGEPIAHGERVGPGRSLHVFGDRRKTGNSLGTDWRDHPKRHPEGVHG